MPFGMHLSFSSQGSTVTEQPIVLCNACPQRKIHTFGLWSLWIGRSGFAAGWGERAGWFERAREAKPSRDSGVIPLDFPAAVAGFLCPTHERVSLCQNSEAA